MANPIPPYGVAIQDAIASGDTDRMRQVANDAEKYLAEFGEIGDGLKKLRAVISGGGGGPYGGHIQPLYGVVIHDAIESGDANRMRAVAQQAEDFLKQADEVRTAHSELLRAMGQEGHG